VTDALQRARSFGEQMPHTENQALLVAKAWGIASIVQSKANHGKEAADSAEHAIRLWNSIQKTSMLTHVQALIKEVQAIRAASVVNGQP
jgi:hypothetical protein